MLYIDINEKNMAKRVLKEAEKRKIEAEIKRLTVGDYLWDNYLVIERKTVSDFVNSIRNGHLETQLLDMQQYEHAFLFISGDFRSLYFKNVRNWTVNHTIGSLCSIAARYDVKILQFPNDSQLIKAIFKIKEKVDKGKKMNAVIRHKKTLNKVNPNFALFLAIPGIGEKRAELLTKTYPNFYEFLNEFKNGKIKLPKTAETFLNSII